ncbi:MAG TPA: SGNH/GDSL hydrolase family protein [Armatimonadota bacterium]|nr:SGNH/GDSL hydrolase family protein [Armatimonadota bacterium]
MTVLAFGCLLVIAASALWAEPTARPTNPPSMSVEVTDGDRVLRTLRVAPPEVVEVRGEAVVIGDDAPHVWARGTRLPALVTGTGSVVVGAVAPGSVVVCSAPGAEPYEQGKDYLLDERWAALGRVAEGRIPQGARVYVDYAYYRSRLDTLQVTARDTPSIRRGKPAAVCPHPAGAARGHEAIANIWVRPGLTAVTAEDIYPIGPPPSFPAPDRTGTAATRKLLAAGGKATIVALGDSVTAGGEASRPELAFPNLFAATLSARYPQAGITLINAGIGGANSDLGLERLDRDVLDHQPQLVVIEFVNDMLWPREKVIANYRRLISRIRAAGAEAVIITPHYMWPEWMGGFDEALAGLKQVATEEKVALADASARWGALRETGIPYETLLVNSINHPDDRGHRLFVDALMELF